MFEMIIVGGIFLLILTMVLGIGLLGGAIIGFLIASGLA
jgi:hypothetical protein